MGGHSGSPTNRTFPVSDVARRIDGPLTPRRQAQPTVAREQLEIFRALPGDFAVRDARELMSYPFFSLSKSKRVRPIDYRIGNVTVRVEGTLEHGLATIWDADVLIWAASQIVEARDAGINPSRRIAVTPYEILTFIGRGTSARDYERLKSALDRLQSTSIATSIRQRPGVGCTASPGSTSGRNTPMRVADRWALSSFCRTGGTAKSLTRRWY